jgi:zinc/manganese transport system substrate-binding protein
MAFRRPASPLVLALSMLALPLLAACGAIPAADRSRGVRIVAAENFWGSIAAQLGGSRAEVQSVIVNPAEDPHAYEPTPDDARAMATAQLAIVNGVGYDSWASHLLSANPTSGRTVLDVGHRLGLAPGDNPHRWYDPADVERVADTITADLRRLDPRHAAYFAAQRAQFEHRGLAAYHALIAATRRRYAGVPVGASESIFALLAPSLGLRLLTPARFMTAVSEGTEVSAQDTLTVQRQIRRHQIRLWVDNAQNVTPEIQQLNALARAARIPVVSVTETLSPATDSFEQWQVAQLNALRRALGAAQARR